MSTVDNEQGRLGEIPDGVAFIDPELARKVVAAALQAQQAWSERAHDGYVPRQDVWSYEENEHGWPANVRGPRRGSDGPNPINWRMVLVAENKSRSYELDGADVVALTDVVEHVLADHDLAARVSPLTAQIDDPDRAISVAKHDAVTLVAEVLNSAARTEDRDARALSDIYALYEQAILAPELRCDLVVPVALRKLELTEPMRIADGVSLEVLSQDDQLARAVSASGSDVNAHLVAAATHAIVLHDRVLTNDRGPLARQIALHYNVPGLEEADRVCEALGILADLEIGYAQICVRPRGWTDTRWTFDTSALDSLATVKRYPREFEMSRGWLMEQPVVSRANLELLPATFAALQSTDKRAQLASRRLAQAGRRTLADDILIDACIGIEALLGEQRDELAHRMGLRAAAALAPAGNTPAISYRVLKAVYGYRSKIVHGDEPSRKSIAIDGKQYSPHGTAVNLLRMLLRAHLASSPPWTPQSLDESIFKALADSAASADGTGPEGSVEAPAPGVGGRSRQYRAGG